MINRITQFTPSTWFDYAHHEPLGTSFGRKYVYDVLNRLTDITDASDVNIAHFGFDELSRRNALNFPNSTSTAYGYDLASRLTSLVTSGPSLRREIVPAEELLRLFDDFLISNAFAVSQGSTSPASIINSYGYTYDFVGNRLTMTDSLGTHTYGYDDLYSLTSSTLPGEGYTYDQVGNRNPSTFVYDNANRLLDDGTYTYTYDDNGNCITKTNKTNPSDVTTYTYDIENQLIVVSHQSSAISYAYDGLGRRIEKNVNGTITRYVYDNEDIITEYDGSNNLVAKYLHGPGVDEPIRITRGGQNYFYHADGLGSIAAITNSSGATVNTYRYDAFGNIVSQTGTLANPYTYTGREFDPETNLYYYRARYYDSRIGRFLQEDHFKGFLDLPSSLNSYLYVVNNPIIFSDPFGLYSLQEFLRDTATYSGIAATGTFFIPGGQIPSIVFGGIAATATGLEISIYSRQQPIDTTKELIKMILPVKKPFDMLSDHLTDLLEEKLSNEIEKNNKEKCDIKK